jgi:hypothetical protein
LGCPAAASVSCVSCQPTWSDERDEDIALPNRLVDPDREILTRLNTGEISEDAVCAESLGKRRMQMLCRRTRVLSTITDEDARLWRSVAAGINFSGRPI